MFTLPLQIKRLMSGFQTSWFFAGGWAIDLFLGKKTRPHRDIEIAIFRKDQAALHLHFEGWQFQKFVKGKPSVWHRDERLALPTHEIHGFNENAQPPQIEILLNESSETEWIYRRNQKVRRSLNKLQHQTSNGLNFLCPEIVLLYKSTNPQPKDEKDFQSTVKYLDPEQKEWLKNSIKVCNSEHHWLQNL